MTATLYGDLGAAGVPISNHESDLYFQDSADSRAILARWPDKAKLATRFECRLTGQTWWDVPFAFLPWWEKQCPVTVAEVIEPGDLKD
jgi:hypothetical protein